MDSRYLTVPNPADEVSQETRKVEFEVRVPEEAPAGPAHVGAHAFYYVCEDVNGTCLYRRQDLTIEIPTR